jgi:hypothetical protein
MLIEKFGLPVATGGASFASDALHCIAWSVLLVGTSCAGFQFQAVIFSQILIEKSGLPIAKNDLCTATHRLQMLFGLN